MIRLQVIGHLGKDATVNEVGGTKVINFSVCHTEKFKDAQGNSKEKSIWVECGKWGEQTGVASYLKKGGQVYVEGTPEVRTYPKNDGTTGTSLALRVLNLQLLGGGQRSEGGEQAQQQEKQPIAAPAGTPANPAGSEDDLPF